ncbi:MAG: sulfatase [Planctomycetes bacterium]|nr:sulfatase [Planctomycetota bacterium]
MAQRRLFRTVTTIGFMLSALVLAAFVVILLGRRGGGRSHPNVIFIAVDTLRADRLGCYGAKPGLTPHIDAIAEQSTRFTHTLSPCNSTSSSFASLHTGTYLKTHGVIQLSTFGYKLEPRMKTFAEYLKDEGYWALGAVSADHLDAEISGLGQGFDRYLDFVAKPQATPDEPPDVKQPAAVTTDRVLGALGEWRKSPDRSKPLFLFVHYFDAHWPYVPPAPWDSQHWSGERPERELIYSTDFGRAADKAKWKDYFVSQYEAEIAYADHEIGRLVDGLREMGLWDRSFVIFTADHGENLGEHGLYFNHQRMYRPVTNVPMLLRLPGQTTAVVSDALVQGIDLMPTVLDGIGVRVPPNDVDGKSLMDLLEGRRKWIHQEIFSEGAGEKEKVVQNATHKLTHLPLPHQSDRRSFELYDLVADPGETRNLAFEASAASTRAALWNKLVEFVGTREVHVRFGPTGAKRRYHASIRGLKSRITNADVMIDFEEGDTARVESSGEIVVDCNAGGGDADELKLLLDDSASLTINASADGAPLRNEDLSIDGHPFERTQLPYVVDWDPADTTLATPLAPSTPEAVLERDENATGGSTRFRLTVGVAGGDARVHARIVGDLDDVTAPEGGAIVRSFDNLRVILDAPPPQATFRFALDRDETRLFFNPIIGDRKVAPADVAVRFPIHFATASLPVPFAYSAIYRFVTGDVAKPFEAPVTLFRVGGFARDPMDPSKLPPDVRKRLKALGYIGG